MALPQLSTTASTDLKARLDCREIAQAVLGRPASRGATWWLFRAPGREDRHPSFGVRPERFIDFASGESGDVFGLLQLLYGLSTFKDAYALAQELAGGVSLVPPRHLHANREARVAHDAPPPPDWQEAALAVVEAAEAYLWSDRPDAIATRDYLMQKRGLTEATIRHFRLGFNPRWQKTRWRKPADNRYASLPPGIVIPCFSAGHLWYVKVRCIIGEVARILKRPAEQLNRELSPKYLNLAGGNPAALYNADVLRPDHPALLVEGEFDALLAHQLTGDLAAVVTVGSASNGLLPHARQQLAQVSCILVCLDNDAAGHDGATRFTATLPKSAHTTHVPLGKDIGEYVVLHQGDLRAFITVALAAARPAPLPCLSLAVRHGLPDTLRAALNRYCYPAIAPTWELWQEGITAQLLAPDEPVGVARLAEVGLQLGRATSIDTLKAGLKAGADLFWGVLQTDSSIESEASSPICKTPRNSSRRGRRSVRYRLFRPDQQHQSLLALAAVQILQHQFPAEGPLVAPIHTAFIEELGFDAVAAERLAAILQAQYGATLAEQPEFQARLEQARLTYQRLARDLQHDHSTPLPADWTYRNATEYVSVLARAMVEAQPDVSRSRQQMARQLGISPRSVDAVLARAGLTNLPCTVDRPITSLLEFTAIAAAYDPAFKGYPVRISIQAGQTVPVERRFDPAQREVVGQALVAGSRVTVRYQQASRQVITSERQPPQKKRQRTVQEGVQDAMLHVPVRTNRSEDIGSWCVQWALKLLGRVTPWGLVEGRLVHRATGEVLAYQRQTVIGLLLNPHGDLAEPEWAALPEVVAQDDLLGEALAWGGVITTFARTQVA